MEIFEELSGLALAGVCSMNCDKNLCTFHFLLTWIIYLKKYLLQFAMLGGHNELAYKYLYYFMKCNKSYIDNQRTVNVLNQCSIGFMEKEYFTTIFILHLRKSAFLEISYDFFFFKISSIIIIIKTKFIITYLYSIFIG